MGATPTGAGPKAPITGVGNEQGEGRSLGRDMGTGLAWSFLNNVIGRLGNFLAGIVVVRLLAQTEFGTYAIALVVLSVILSMNELGVSVAIVHHRGNPAGIAPTVMTLSLAASGAFAALGFFAAPALAATLGAPEASGLIRLLLLGVLLDGVASVPNALMSRFFMQRRRLVIDTVAFCVATPVTIGLALTGSGAWSLGWGAVAGNATTAVLALAWSPVKARLGWDRTIVKELLTFGLPLSGASLLLLLLLNVDNVIVSRSLGAAALGYYALAFNLCSWPITAVTSAIRRVAIALFARVTEHSDDGGSDGFGAALTVVTAVTLPMCILLAGYAGPLIGALYGPRWVPAAAALVPLAVFSVIRVWVELAYDFLAGSGRSGRTVWLHAIWLVALVPGMLLGARLNGIAGVGLAQAAVAVLVAVPTLLWLMRGAGVRLHLGLRRLVPLCLGAAVMGGVVLGSRAVTEDPFVAMLVGSPVAVVLYLACTWTLKSDALSLWRLRAQPEPAIR